MNELTRNSENKIRDEQGELNKYYLYNNQTGDLFAKNQLK